MTPTTGIIAAIVYPCWVAIELRVELFLPLTGEAFARKSECIANQALNNGYSFLATSSPSGRGTLDSNSNTAGYIISSSKLVVLDKTALKPSLTVLEK